MSLDSTVVENIDISEILERRFPSDVEERREWLEKLKFIADNYKDSRALFLVGTFYQYGYDVCKIDLSIAMKYYLKGCEVNNLDCSCNLGQFYFNGWHVTSNRERAYEYLMKAAEGGHSYAQLFLYHYFSKDLGALEESIINLKQMADSGDPTSQHRLGFCYSNGICVDESKEDAMRYYKLAAQLGHAPSGNNLAVSYYEGYNLARDVKDACIWYKRAADQGNINAQFNLARRYGSGEGVVKDNYAALYYFKLSALQGNNTAKKFIETNPQLMKGTYMNFCRIF